MQKHRPRSEWHEIVTKWETSGLTKQEYCTQLNIPYSTFGYWRSRFNKEKQTGTTFVKIKPTATEKPKTGIVQIELGYCTIGFHSDIDGAKFLELLKAIKEASL
jgi:hypothetical protein